jgi:preprotein translocase subunit SecD
MHSRSTSRLAVLVAIAKLLAGCTSTAPEHMSSPGRSLRLRLATSSVDVPKHEGSPQSVVLNFNKADTRTLDAVSRQAMGKSLAILLDGRVLSAPIVEEPITTSQVTSAFATSSEATQVASELGASRSS